MNLNELAREITLREGKKKSLSIADVKEVLRIIDEIHPGIFLLTDLCDNILFNGTKPKPRKTRKGEWVSSKSLGLYDPDAANKKAIIHKARKVKRK